MGVRTDRWRWLAALLCGLVAGFPLAGCDQLEEQLAKQCEQTERSYRQALQEEETNLAGADGLPDKEKRPAHFGLTLSDELLSDMANVVVEPALKGVLELVSTVRVGGQSVDLDTDGDVLDLTLQAADACDHCFRIGVDLGGALVADIPSVGVQRANLDGGASLVAPIILEEGEEKSVAVKLDFEQLAKLGASTVNARIGGLSRDWEEKLRGPLSDLILRALGNNLKPVTLVEFNGPSFGIDGFELTPVALRSDSDHGAIFAGFSTNIEALNTESMPGVEPVTDLADDQNIALSFQPQLILNVLSLLMSKEEKVARTYTGDGEADTNGSFHVTLDTFKVGPDAIANRPDAGMADAGGFGDGGFSSPDAASMTDGEGGLAPGTPYGLGFKVYNFKSGGLCFSAEARATGGVAIEEQNLGVSISDVSFTSNTVPPSFLSLANWTSSQFIQESRTLVEKSFDGENLKVPGTQMNVGPLELGIRPNTFVVRGKSATMEMESEESGSGE